MKDIFSKNRAPPEIFTLKCPENLYFKCTERKKMLIFLNNRDRHGEDLCRTISEVLSDTPAYIKLKALSNNSAYAQETRVVADVTEGITSTYSMCTDDRSHFLEVEKEYLNSFNLADEIASDLQRTLLTEEIVPSFIKKAATHIRLENLADESAEFVTDSSDILFSILDKIAEIDSGIPFPSIRTSSGGIFPAFPLRIPEKVTHVNFMANDDEGTIISNELYNVLDESLLTALMKAKESQKDESSFYISILGSEDEVVKLSFGNTKSGKAVISSLINVFSQIHPSD